MSTLKNNISAKRIALLASQGEIVFHIKDLANLWSIQDANTLRVTLKRYTDQSILFRIYRGFYSLLPVLKLDPIILGSKAIHAFCYLTAETVLFQTGYIHQKIDIFTFVSEKNRKIDIGDLHFLSRQLHPKYLYNHEGILVRDGIRVATSERAIADILYLNPFYHFDRIVNWANIKKMQEKIGYPLTPLRYDFT